MRILSVPTSTDPSAGVQVLLLSSLLQFSAMVLQSSLAASYSRAIEKVCYNAPQLLEVDFIFSSEKGVFLYFGTNTGY